MRGVSIKPKGFTLLECLLSLLLISLIFVFSFANFSAGFERARARNVLNKLKSIIQFAEINAMQTHRVLYLCGSRDGDDCNSGFSAGYLLYAAQSNHSRVIGQRLRIGPKLLTARLKWHGFLNDQYLKFTPYFNTQALSGHFDYCWQAGHGSQIVAYQLIINRLGRVRLEMKKSCEK